MDVSKFQKPHKVGTGIWFCLGLMSVTCITKQDLKYFINFMKTLSDVFPCDKCGVDFREYIKSNPLEDITPMTATDYDNYKKNSAFAYIFDLHNSVNFKLHKTIVSYQDAIEYFGHLDSKVCTDCGNSKNTDNSTHTDNSKIIDNSKITDNFNNDLSINISLSDVKTNVKTNVKSNLRREIRSHSNKKITSLNKHKYITFNNTPNNTTINTTNNKLITQYITPNNTLINTPNNTLINTPSIKSIISINTDMFNPIIKIS